MKLRIKAANAAANAIASDALYNDADSKFASDQAGPPSKGNRGGGRSKRGDNKTTTTNTKKAPDNALTNSMEDVPDVAGGARNHRNIFQSYTTADDNGQQGSENNTTNSVIAPRSTRATRSSRTRGASRPVVNYDEDKVGLNLVYFGHLHISYRTAV